MFGSLYSVYSMWGSMLTQHGQVRRPRTIAYLAWTLEWLGEIFCFDFDVWRFQRVFWCVVFCSKKSKTSEDIYGQLLVTLALIDWQGVWCPRVTNWTSWQRSRKKRYFPWIRISDFIKSSWRERTKRIWCTAGRRANQCRNLKAKKNWRFNAAGCCWKQMLRGKFLCPHWLVVQFVFALLSRPTMRFGRLFDEEFLNLVLPVGVSGPTEFVDPVLWIPILSYSA